MKKSILVIDDDLDMCTLLNRFLTKHGYIVDTAHSAAKGIEKFKDGKFDVVLCDYRLGDKKDGKDILIEIKQHNPQTIVFIITGYSDIKTAVDVIKAGAHDYITKPLIPDEVLNVLNAALNSHEEVTNNAKENTGAQNITKSKNSSFKLFCFPRCFESWARNWSMYFIAPFISPVLS